jgi:hypothetical protein
MKIILRSRRATTALMIACLMLPQALWADQMYQTRGVQSAVDEEPNAAIMVGDLVVARPIGVVMTVGGAALWLVSLPFTLLAGHAGEAAQTLMQGPAEATFMRCLGCRNTGYAGKDLAQNENNKAQEQPDAVAVYP